jgi:hypothetical protein
MVISEPWQRSKALHVMGGGVSDDVPHERKTDSARRATGRSGAASEVARERPKIDPAILFPGRNWKTCFNQCISFSTPFADLLSWGLASVGKLPWHERSLVLLHRVLRSGRPKKSGATHRASHGFVRTARCRGDRRGAAPPRAFAGSSGARRPQTIVRPPSGSGPCFAGAPAASVRIPRRESRDRFARWVHARRSRHRCFLKTLEAGASRFHAVTRFEASLCRMAATDGLDAAYGGAHRPLRGA